MTRVEHIGRATLYLGDCRMTDAITYRGWEIDKYRKPDGCFYAYAPDYDGLTPEDTQFHSTLNGLCGLIDDVTAERELAPA